MLQPLATVHERATLAEVARLMLDRKVEAVSVVGEDGAARGLIDERDLVPHVRRLPFSIEEAPNFLGRWISEPGIEQAYRSAGKVPAAQVMRPPLLVGEDEPLKDVVKLLMIHGAHPVLVHRAGVPVGIIGTRELLRLVAAT